MYCSQPARNVIMWCTCDNVPLNFQGAKNVAGHGTNVDGLWLRAKAPKGLQVGSVVKFGASSRSYTVRPSCFAYTIVGCYWHTGWGCSLLAFIAGRV